MRCQVAMTFTLVLDTERLRRELPAVDLDPQAVSAWLRHHLAPTLTEALTDAQLTRHDWEYYIDDQSVVVASVEVRDDPEPDGDPA